MHIKICPICLSDKIQFFIRTSDKHYGLNKHFFDVYQCKDCNLSFLNPMITDEDLFQLYPKDYYEPDASFLSKNLFMKILTRINGFLINVEASDIQKLSFRGKILLDLGIGDGDSLIKLKRKGAIVNGVEIRKDACIKANELGLNVKNGTLQEVSYPPDYFDYIRSNHSFEHLTDPNETLHEVYRILKKGGTLFIGVPNNRGLASLLFRKNWYYLGVPFHPYNYNKTALSILLNKHGFEVKRIIYNGNFNGLLGSIQILLNRKNGKKSHEGRFTNFFTRILFNQIARLLNMFRLGDCIEIIAVKK